MNAQAVTALINGLNQAGVNFIASLPGRGVGQAVEAIMQDKHFVHVPVGNEEDAIGICAGAWLGGKVPAVVADNHGMVLATHALLLTTYNFGGFPMLLVADHGGDFGDDGGAFYYACGIHFPRILEQFQIHYTIVRESSKLTAEVMRGVKTALTDLKPAAILLSGEEMYGE